MYTQYIWKLKNWRILMTKKLTLVLLFAVSIFLLRIEGMEEQPPVNRRLRVVSHPERRPIWHRQAPILSPFEGVTNFPSLRTQGGYGESTIARLEELLDQREVKHYRNQGKQQEARTANLNRRLDAALKRNSIKDFKYLIEKGDINPSDMQDLVGPLLIKVINKALEDKKFLELVEYLLLKGAQVNRKDYLNFTPLHLVIEKKPLNEHDEKFLFEFIMLLLGYGAIIDQETLEFVKKKSLVSPFYKDVLDQFEAHENLLNKAESDPDDDALTQAIGYNKPYVVKMIVEKKPELVTQTDINIAQTTSPFSVPVLKKALRTKKFRQIAAENNLPIELIQHVEKIVNSEEA